VLLAATHGRGAWIVPNADRALSPTYDLRGQWCDVPERTDRAQPFSLSGRVANQGAAPVTGSFVQEFRLSDDLRSC